ncbi:hypothetical protein BJV74DRAFT_794430 [Russula compacta]|nr:hypothetical protein BJV74DRAFT_794430 [Russula compacta]
MSLPSPTGWDASKPNISPPPRHPFSLFPMEVTTFSKSPIGDRNSARMPSCEHSEAPDQRATELGLWDAAQGQTQKQSHEVAAALFRCFCPHACTALESLQHRYDTERQFKTVTATRNSNRTTECHIWHKRIKHGRPRGGSSGLFGKVLSSGAQQNVLNAGWIHTIQTGRHTNYDYKLGGRTFRAERRGAQDP